MKLKLVLKTDRDQTIWDNVERTAQRVQQWPAWKRGYAAIDANQVTANTTVTPSLAPTDNKK